MPVIRQNLTTVNFNSRGTNPTWIVIHNTYNHTSKAGTAYNNTVYFKNVYRGASAHYFIDDGDEIWQCVKDTDSAWHVGDAASRNGAGNWNAIGIEVCETNDGYFTDKEQQNLTWLVTQLMRKYGIDANHVCRHYDVTGKSCPWYYVSARRWEQLKSQITEEDMAIDYELLADRVVDKLMRYVLKGDNGYTADIGRRICRMDDKTQAIMDSLKSIDKKTK